ncbi:MAG TPA: fibronectin type III domain-containing protein [Candidatus Acidoferrum sp.]|nr:fibronectin type III domain-containing protein [Candidatus Acidoferrum sp.]
MRALTLVLLAALSVAACGKSAPPVAPDVRVPAFIADLRGAVEDDAVALAWTNPQRRADGARLRDLTEIRLYRSEDDGVMPPKPALLVEGKIAGYREIAVIDLVAPAPAIVQGHTVRFVDRDGLRLGRRYTYVVVSEDGIGRTSAPSNRFAIVFIAPPEAPATPTVTAGDGEVRVRWQPPARLRDGGAPGTLAYEVLRSGAPDAPPDAIVPVPAGQTEYVDRNLQNERTYHYAVRAVRQEGGATARGPASARAAATPTRATPLTPPTNLVAAPSPNTVRLSWTASPDRNVVGYVIYRATGPGEAVRVGAVRSPATTFIDRDLASGTYRYTVTGQDATARANESAASNEVSVTVP